MAYAGSKLLADSGVAFFIAFGEEILAFGVEFECGIPCALGVAGAFHGVHLAI